MRISEIFTSIEGEACRWYQGRQTQFIRFAGCNLQCEWCDTKYANEGKYADISMDDLISTFDESPMTNFTITGGEPFLQEEDLYELMFRLIELKGAKISVETNGTFPIPVYRPAHVGWVADWKLPSSRMAHCMNIKNYGNLKDTDIVKFVVADRFDFDTALWAQSVLKQNKCLARYAFSPCFGKLEPKQLVKWLDEEEIHDYILSVQLHKLLDFK
jgi:7-carboxy-7-deazaguanine synthase